MWTQYQGHSLIKLLSDKSALAVAKPGSVTTVNNKCGLNVYSNQF